MMMKSHHALLKCSARATAVPAERAIRTERGLAKAGRCLSQTASTAGTAVSRPSFSPEPAHHGRRPTNAPRRKRAALLMAALGSAAALAPRAAGYDFTWVGPSGSWNVPANWSPPTANPGGDLWLTQSPLNT